MVRTTYTAQLVPGPLLEPAGFLALEVRHVNILTSSCSKHDDVVLSWKRAG